MVTIMMIMMIMIFIHGCGKSLRTGPRGSAQQERVFVFCTHSIIKRKTVKKCIIITIILIVNIIIIIIIIVVVEIQFVHERMGTRVPPILPDQHCKSDELCSLGKNHLI